MRHYELPYLLQRSLQQRCDPLPLAVAAKPAAVIAAAAAPRPRDGSTLSKDRSETERS